MHFMVLNAAAFSQAAAVNNARDACRPFYVIRSGSMSEVVYRSHVRVESVKGPLRRAYLPAENQPVLFGVHGAVAEHYKVPPAVLEPHATTLDYVVAAVAG